MRVEQWPLLRLRRHARRTVHLSAVVGSELIRAARNESSMSQLRGLWDGFQRLRRIVVPTGEDWHDAGIVLAQVARKYGYESLGQARLVHDTLIALSARRLGIAVVTLNASGFQRISEFRRLSVLTPADLAL